MGISTADMTGRGKPMRKRSGYMVLAVAASIYILFNFVTTSLIIVEMTDEKLSLWNTFSAELIVFVPVGIFFFSIQKLYKAKRWLFASVSVKTVAIHGGMLLLLIAIHSVWQVYFNSVFLGVSFIPEMVYRDMMAFLNLRVLIYIITISLVVGIVKIQEKENSMLEQSELKLKLQKTSFRELELKLNPEIIYPNLDFVKQNACQKPEEASELILNLSKQLRILIDSIDEERIPLRKDLRFYRYYFQALQLRLGRKLHIESQIDERLLDAQIPSLVLMSPFLEKLFFGTYSAYTARLHQICYQGRMMNGGTVRLALRFESISRADELEAKIWEDGMLDDIEKLIEMYDSSSLQTKSDSQSLTIMLSMMVS